MTNNINLRSREPVAQCLIRRLVVPRVYFDARWPTDGDEPVDLLLIDRDGFGDPHLVYVNESAREALARVPALLVADAPFRWIAFLQGTDDAQVAAELVSQRPLYPLEGAGRIGVIEVVHMRGGDLGANVRTKAERFPVVVHDLAVAFSHSHEAHIQFGE